MNCNSYPKAGLTDYENPERVIIALEPEAASIFCRKLRMRDCVLDEVKRKSIVGSMMDWQIGNEFEGTILSRATNLSIQHNVNTPNFSCGTVD